MKMEPAKSFVVDKSLRGLGYALLHQETWPPGFKWYYGDCKTCAIGLACLLWCVNGVYNIQSVAKLFDITVCDASFIFCCSDGYARYCEITPRMVADRIDAYVARQQAKHA